MLVPTFGGVSQSDKKTAFLRLMARIRAIPVPSAKGHGSLRVRCSWVCHIVTGAKKPQVLPGVLRVGVA